MAGGASSRCRPVTCSRQSRGDSAIAGRQSLHPPKGPARRALAAQRERHPEHNTRRCAARSQVSGSFTPGPRLPCVYMCFIGHGSPGGERCAVAVAVDRAHSQISAQLHLMAGGLEVGGMAPFPVRVIPPLIEHRLELLRVDLLRGRGYTRRTKQIAEESPQTGPQKYPYLRTNPRQKKKAPTILALMRTPYVQMQMQNTYILINPWMSYYLPSTTLPVLVGEQRCPELTPSGSLHQSLGGPGGRHLRNISKRQFYSRKAYCETD
ncbi:hypothetical protein T310_7819 [Rasamsonia emersonii CBS 393.64]|uniref:Uncharacterized protein n=1 Tax=Rasamsonia emersonii (strain ATCC 16479 / CBS 393.64 / IMI 116815) TaxID=1408163 RepID=A0A0F4YKY0_RASE3|nr:hypothetical protein T310_7819 [Rasamsonia emersonii CBS 393.64]KKA18243.1 hypothetical protein T310_7819 [Rasamsonia emersonii CBS 393.64]